MNISFQTPYLVQRLNKPPVTQNLEFEKGLISKERLSKEVGVIFADIMSFDYMGSAEFEWGALPKSLEYCIKYAKDNDLMACEVDITTIKDITKPVYYICHKDIEENVVSWIRKAGRWEEPRCKEGVRLMDSLHEKEYSKCGWYDLENRFWFFTNRKMFLTVKKLFGV